MARIARTMRSGGRSKASSRVRKPARRRPSSSACTWSDSRSSRGLESNSSTPCGRLAGGHHPARGVQPAGGPAAAELALGVAALALVRRARGRAAAPPRPCARPSARRGSPRARGRPRPRRSGRRRRAAALGERRALAALARELDGRGDVVGLEQRPAQRLELGEVVLAVAALRAARLGVAEAALPAPQGVGAHPEQLGGGVGPDPAHLTSISTEPRQRRGTTSHIHALGCEAWRPSCTGFRRPEHRAGWRFCRPPDERRASGAPVLARVAGGTDAVRAGERRFRSANAEAARLDRDQRRAGRSAGGDARRQRADPRGVLGHEPHGQRRLVSRRRSAARRTWPLELVVAERARHDCEQVRAR